MLKKIKALFVKEKQGFKFNPIEQVGNWRLEMNRPWGFIIRNMVPPTQEFHFMFQSSGWFTSRCYRNKNNKAGDIRVLNAFGTVGGNPFLVDQESCKVYGRVAELQQKKDLTPEEMTELLKLSGLRSGG